MEKFNVEINGKIDCRAYYQENGVFKRLGADENNNVQDVLSESDVLIAINEKNIDYNLLKTETEMIEILSQFGNVRD